MTKENSLQFTMLNSVEDINRALYRGKLVSFSGLVNAMRQHYPECKRITFKCSSCGELYIKEQTITIGNKIVNEPGQCEECGGTSFDTVDRDFMDVQLIEIADINELKKGNLYTITLMLKGNLIDSAVLGDLVEIKGIVETNRYGRKYFNFVNAKSINKLPKSKGNIKINPNDEKLIKMLAKEPKIFDKLVESFAPSVRGCSDVKEAIILQLFSSGSESETQLESFFRPPNILLIDDNELVSEILKFAMKVSPTGIFLNGKKPLPIIPKINTKFGRHLLEAGVLILADKSILCIDHINSLRYGKDDIKNVMDAQIIAINEQKDNYSVSTAMSTQTSILAGIHPKRKLNRKNPVSSQIYMKTDLFSEFDLVFSLNNENYYSEAYTKNIQLNVNKSDKSMKIQLNESLIRKYISYTNHLNPQLVDKHVSNYLALFYAGLRGNLGKSVINQMKFKSLIKLAKASARIHLRDEITIDDAKRVIKVYKNSLKSIGIYLENGQPDIRMIIPRNELNKNKKILRMIYEDFCKENEELTFNRLVEAMLENSDLEEGLIQILVADEYGFI